MSVPLSEYGTARFNKMARQFYKIARKEFRFSEKRARNMLQATKPIEGATHVLVLPLGGVKYRFAVIPVSYSPNKSSFLKVTYQ
ncbi:MAG: hypothetical protein QW343_01335 [Candidatus Norongarragalinales archaeon]